MKRAEKLMLNFISKLETGTTGPAAYEVVFGNHQRDKGFTPITTMTVKDLLAAQVGWGKRWKSSAAGAYQIIRPTMLELVKDLHIPLDAKFTPDLQDKLGLALLRRRGFNKFLDGQMTQAAFALQLAQEWASIPLLAPTTNRNGIRNQRGESYYSGDGLNKALTRPEELEAKLDEVFGMHTVETVPAGPAPVKHGTPVSFWVAFVLLALGVVAWFIFNWRF